MIARDADPLLRHPRNRLPFFVARLKPRVSGRATHEPHTSSYVADDAIVRAIVAGGGERRWSIERAEDRMLLQVFQAPDLRTAEAVRDALDITGFYDVLAVEQLEGMPYRSEAHRSWTHASALGILCAGFSDTLMEEARSLGGSSLVWRHETAVPVLRAARGLRLAIRWVWALPLRVDPGTAPRGREAALRLLELVDPAGGLPRSWHGLERRNDEPWGDYCRRTEQAASTFINTISAGSPGDASQVWCQLHFETEFEHTRHSQNGTDDDLYSEEP